MRKLAIALVTTLAAIAPAWAGGAANSDANNFGLSGDWGGLRTQLKNEGVTFGLKAHFQGATNPAGGTKQTTAGAGELDFGAIGDLGKLVGDRYGKVRLKISKRYGAPLGPHAGFDPLMEVQSIHGRGDIWRLSELSLEQGFVGNRLNIKGGRLNPGEDFDHFDCKFQNLTFCGAQAGNVVGDYWFNHPVSEWGGRVKGKLPKSIYAEVGAYQVNPLNLSRGFTFDDAHATGTLLPFEIGWKPAHGPNGLPGDYKLGGWYSTTRAPDVYSDVNGGPKAVTGLPAANDQGRDGVYLSLKQQVTGHGGKTPKGLSLFLNFVAADRATSMIDRQIAIGGSYRGLIPSRPNDAIALATGATHVNDRYAHNEGLLLLSGAGTQPVQHTEYVTELDYRAQVVKGLKLTPNLQVIDDPGGVDSRDTAVVLGLTADATF